MDGSDALTFRASLEPKLYRDIALANTASLYDLAEEINRAYGFHFDHCFGFYDNLKGNILHSGTFYELFVDIGEDDEPAP